MFIGEIVFVIIYYVIKVICKSYDFNVKKFFSILTQKYKKLKKEAGKAADKYKEMLKNHEYSTKEEGKSIIKSSLTCNFPLSYSQSKIFIAGLPIKEATKIFAG